MLKILHLALTAFLAVMTHLVHEMLQGSVT